MHFGDIRGEEAVPSSPIWQLREVQLLLRPSEEESKTVIASIFPCAQEGIFAVHLQYEDY